ncbi:hypothetical protein CBFG_01468 [Clostridiales bacterium 1_7_47FAA]|nr:hypothetical protein CBFG_01468 [Clostridiales bacterium 1_7_47FAA]
MSKSQCNCKNQSYFNPNRYCFFARLFMGNSIIISEIAEETRINGRVINKIYNSFINDYK